MSEPRQVDVSGRHQRPQTPTSGVPTQGLRSPPPQLERDRPIGPGQARGLQVTSRCWARPQTSPWSPRSAWAAARAWLMFADPESVRDQGAGRAPYLSLVPGISLVRTVRGRPSGRSHSWVPRSSFQHFPLALALLSGPSVGKEVTLGQLPLPCTGLGVTGVRSWPPVNFISTSKGILPKDLLYKMGFKFTGLRTRAPDLNLPFKMNYKEKKMKKLRWI